MQKLSMDDLNRKSVEEFKQAEKSPIITVLDNIRSMNNVGSVFRTSDAFLTNGIYLCGYTPQPPHREINKTAIGATETVHWEYFATTQLAIDKLKSDGYRIFGVEQADTSISLENVMQTIASDAKIAIVMGNEVEGVDENILSQCEACVEIPQFGTKHSLNISVAAGIVLWELTRAHLLKK